MSLNSGSCWEILEIESTTEKKLIKRAYHKLLRQYKPDEKPNEFKKLYEAYQDALEWEDYDNWDEEFTWDDNDEKQHWEDDSNEEEAFEYEKDEEDILLNEYWRRWEIFEEKVDALTYDNNYPELFNQLKNWEFIEELQLENDIELHQRAADYLFNAIGSFDEKNENFLLNNEVITYLNKIFLWEKYWQKYDDSSTMFEYLTIAKVAPKITQPTIYPLANISNRLSSFFIDFGIALIVLAVLQFEFENLLIIYILLYSFHFWILGLRTPGQMFMKVETLEGDECEQPSKTARGIRVIFTALNLYGITLLIADPLDDNPLVYIIGIVNLLFWVSQKRLLQDWSGTRVYDVSKD